MPLVKIFARSTLAKPVPLAAIQAKLCDIWGTKPNTTKLILQRVEDWTDESFQEDVYVDIRAYGAFLLFHSSKFKIDNNSVAHNSPPFFFNSRQQEKMNELANLYWME